MIVFFDEILAASASRNGKGYQRESMPPVEIDPRFVDGLNPGCMITGGIDPRSNNPRKYEPDLVVCRSRQIICRDHDAAGSPLVMSLVIDVMSETLFDEQINRRPGHRIDNEWLEWLVVTYKVWATKHGVWQ